MNRNITTQLLFFVFLFAWPMLCMAQDKKATIYLVNGSFEDVPQCCASPKGWFNCGTNGESPPDIQPGSFEVNKAPNNGETYLGLVVRDNETWESIGQRIQAPMEKGKCYEMSIDLARAELYLSLSRTTGKEVNYATPIKLKIYGGNGFCDKRELLAESAVIKHHRWLSYKFPLRPKKGTYSYIVLEAYYNTPTLFPYNGNLLMDNASEIVEVDCEQKEEPKEEPIEPPVAVNNPPTGGKKPIKEAVQQPVPYVFTDKGGPTFAGVKVAENSVIQLEKIQFPADKFELKKEVEPALQEIYDFLKQNTAVVVEIGGHTNNVPPDSYCDTLSTARAKAVSDWLVGKGIPNSRVKFQGYGKRKPIASNKNAVGRKKNQRVEIKILSVDG